MKKTVLDVHVLRLGNTSSFCDDRCQQTQVSLPETEQWYQRQAGCLLPESPHFSQLNSAQVRKDDITLLDTFL